MSGCFTLQCTSSADAVAVGSESKMQGLSSKSSLFAIFALIVTTCRYSGAEGSSGDTVCRTETCVRVANEIKGSINADISPCDDFYAHACGKWNDSHSLPASDSQVNNFNLIRKVVAARLSDIFSVETVTGEAKSLSFVRRLFRAANDTKSLDKQGIKPLSDLIDRLTNVWRWQKAMTQVIGETGLSVIASVIVNADPFNSTKYVISLDQPSFGIGRTDLLDEDDPQAVRIREAYKLLLTQYVRQIVRIEHPELMAGMIVELETELAKVATPTAERRDVLKMTKKMTVSQVRSELGKEWIDIVTGILTVAGSDVSLKEDDFLIVNDISYFRKALAILNSERFRTTVPSYIATRLVQSLAFLSTDQVRTLQFEFEKVSEGITAAHRQEDLLSEAFITFIPSLVGRLYVDKHFTPGEKAAASDLIEDVIKQFRSMLVKAQWMGDPAVAEALEKIDHLKKNIGYPDWITNDTVIDKIFDFDPSPRTGLQLFTEMKSVATKIHFSRLSAKTVDKDYEWPMSPAQVDAAYEPSQNSITFPAAVLQGVFFGATKPKYLNYGAIGAVIGHEIGHGFDDQGAQYDHEGNIHNWWTADGKKRFEEKAACFQEEYSSVFVPEVGMKLDGRNTLGENIADNGGIHQSLEALVTLLKTEAMPSLPDLDYSSEQMFFYANGNIWCGLIRDEALRNQILTDPHSPAKYRINVPFQNSGALCSGFWMQSW